MQVFVEAPGGKRVEFGSRLPLAFILGPCVIESRDHALRTATFLAELAERQSIPLVYKSSFDKANRTSASSYRGLGMDEALQILADVKAATGLPITTDVHEREQCAPVAEVADILQIPAFLSRQTDLLVAAAAARRGGNGYNTLVVDMRGLVIMAETDKPVIFDATHSVQQPGGRGDSSGGERQYAPVLARAAVAVGVAGVFIETHEDPDNAPSDGANMIPLGEIETLVADLKALDRLAKGLQ